MKSDVRFCTVALDPSKMWGPAIAGCGEHATQRNLHDVPLNNMATTVKWRDDFGPLNEWRQFRLLGVILFLILSTASTSTGMAEKGMP